MKALVIHNDGYDEKFLYDAIIVGTGDKSGHRIELLFSELDKSCSKPGQSAGLLMVYNDGILLIVGDKETWYDWAQIEVVGMLYDLYNKYFKDMHPASNEVKE